MFLNIGDLTHSKDNFATTFQYRIDGFRYEDGDRPLRLLAFLILQAKGGNRVRKFQSFNDSSQISITDSPTIVGERIVLDFINEKFFQKVITMWEYRYKSRTFSWVVEKNMNFVFRSLFLSKTH